MDFKKLYYFIELANTLHFSKAAEALYISQSTLSYNIAELEEELGVCLFSRDKRCVRLTEAGMRFLIVAQQIVSLIEGFKSESYTMLQDNNTIFKLNLCFDKSSLRFDLLGINEIIYQTKVNFPNSIIDSKYASLSEILKWLRNKKIDLGFIVFPRERKIPADFNAFEILTTCLSIVSSQKITDNNIIQSFSTHPLYLLNGDRLWTNQILGILKSIGVSPSIRWENDFTSMLSRVSLGDGITIFPRNEFEAENKSGRNLKVYDINHKDAIISYYAIWSKENVNTSILQIINQLNK